ncbi:hypothetical protein JD844_004160 [Phrynosoma platyrhinos]|uniref:Solute carrier family 25 member 43 n=1 Tax=Phrynosoma platyrhinos TaxID=52577 RepID=A0ABQ7TME7_PHRPL|nr:hypothetical protein JD844_004160 [Phrynosoma platyrhinos]
MATWKRDGRLTAAQRLGCAGLAGAVGLSATAPLEVLTVVAQVGAPVYRGGLWASGRRLCRAQGLGALWKGNLTACLRLCPYSALQVASYRRFVMLFVDDLGHISQWSSIMAGSLAGMVAAIATYPTEVIKTRLIIQNRLEPSYKGILHAFLGFTPLQNFINGCLAASVAQTLSFPFETVKRKMQAQSPCLPHNGGVDVHFVGMIDCFKQTMKTKGVLALWNGLTANLLRIVPYFGVMFSTFECCRRVCLYRNGYIDSPLSYKLTPGVDQSLQPQELQEFKLLGKRNF